MSLIILLLVLVGIFGVAGLVVMLILRDGSKSKKSTKAKENVIEDLTDQVKEDVEHIFNDEFREELRNRGRLHFEKIIGENAMFLQQDLRLTTSQLNDFMKTEVTHVLKEEFAKYEESINDAKQLAIDSIQKTQDTIEQQRELLSAQLSEQLNSEKSRTLARFESRMADVVNHYVLEAVGDQIDLSEQLDFILSQLEDNKEAIMRDIRDGA
jgi:predicted component of type VI protein secretion system